MQLYTSDISEGLALEELLLHPMPFTQNECANLKGPLRIERARSLSLIKYCINLESLEIFACEIEDLNFLEYLSNLVDLKVRCSTIKDISALTHCQALENLELLFTFAEDLNPLMNLPALKTGSMLGNPWTFKSYHELRPKLLKKLSERWQKTPRIEFSIEADWQFTRELQQANIPACFSIFDGQYYLVRPGVPRVVNANCDFLKISRDLARIQFNEFGQTLDSLFNSFLGDRDEDSLKLSFSFQTHRIVGDGIEAETWIRESSIPEETRDSLLQFVQHFPNVQFAKKDADFWEKWELRVNIQLPKWLRSILEVLSDIAPDVPSNIQFDRFDHWSPNSGHLNKIWYQLALVQLNNTQRCVVEKNQLFPIAQWLETGHSILAVNLTDPEDKYIYEYDESDVSSSDGLYEPARIVFESYGHMLEHVVAIKVKEQVINACN
ncbi:MAG: hypothetical protein QNJ18_05320 [Xenococcaceae cyanobacterium MO_167.B52]|nr:hypothetical protein [Xenococcaceae cyanobacterium MO_167.B52]